MLHQTVHLILANTANYIREYEWVITYLLSIFHKQQYWPDLVSAIVIDVYELKKIFIAYLYWSRVGWLQIVELCRQKQPLSYFCIVNKQGMTISNLKKKYWIYTNVC